MFVKRDVLVVLGPRACCSSRIDNGHEASSHQLLRSARIVGARWPRWLFPHLPSERPRRGPFCHARQLGRAWGVAVSSTIICQAKTPTPISNILATARRECQDGLIGKGEEVSKMSLQARSNFTTRPTGLWSEVDCKLSAS